MSGWLERLKQTVLDTAVTTVAAWENCIEADPPEIEAPYTDELGFDVFASLHDVEPRLRPEAHAVHPVRAELIAYLHGLASFQEVRGETMLRPPVAAGLTPYFYEELKKAQDRIPPPPSPDDPPDQAAQKRKKHESAMRAARRKILQAAVRAAQAAEVARELAAMGWDNSPGQFLRSAVTSQTLQAIAQIVRRVHRWFGRIRRARAEARTRVVRRGVNVRGVALGRDLRRLVPTELVRLGDPDLEPLFWKDWLEGSLMIYDVEGRAPEAARGDVIVLVDESGSMEGEPVAYAKAFAFVLRVEAQAEGRRCEIASFSAKPADLTPLPNDATQAEAAEWLGRFIDGGTDFDHPLRYALRVAREGNLRKPDVVMLTDGVCRVSPAVKAEVAEAKRSLGLRLWVFYFGAYDRSLRDIADAEYIVDLTDGGEAAISEFTQNQGA